MISLINHKGHFLSGIILPPATHQVAIMTPYPAIIIGESNDRHSMAFTVSLDKAFYCHTAVSVSVAISVELLEVTILHCLFITIVCYSIHKTAVCQILNELKT